jgi:perosamine synthetase
MINIYEPNIKKYSKSAINAINTGWISNHGEYIQKSTTLLKQILKIKHCILMSNGTCATHCLFLSIKYKYPDINKIYVPNNSYIAAYNTALMVYNINQVEVMKMDINTWNIDTTNDYILSLDKNAAVLIVHNLGNIVNVPKLKQIRPDLIFVEDNCEGLFGKYNDKYSGTSEDSLCSSASFYGNKIITTGEGGAFLTNHDDIYNHIIKVYSQGMSNIRYLHDVHSYNYRMTNIEAAFLYDQLNDLQNILDNKNKIFENYRKLLNNLIINEKISLFEKEDNTENADWIFALRIKNNTKSIEETICFFKNNNVDIRPFFYPINYHSHLHEIKNNDEISKILNNEIIMIPSSPNITFEEQQKVVDTILNFVFLNLNIQVFKIDSSNINVLEEFIKKIDNKHFRYFNKRGVECIENHKCTFIFYDIYKKEYFGYTHIDYEKSSNKNWFGIYLCELYRGKKIGGLLLNYTLQNIILDEIHLSVDHDNINAIKLYEKCGFEIYNKIQDIYYMKK